MFAGLLLKGNRLPSKLEPLGTAGDIVLRKMMDNKSYRAYRQIYDRAKQGKKFNDIEFSFSGYTFTFFREPRSVYAINVTKGRQKVFTARCTSDSIESVLASIYCDEHVLEWLEQRKGCGNVQWSVDPEPIGYPVQPGPIAAQGVLQQAAQAATYPFGTNTVYTVQATPSLPTSAGYTTTSGWLAGGTSIGLGTPLLSELLTNSGSDKSGS